MTSAPNVIVVAGPNGAGKSTAAPALLRDFAKVFDFVNADIIAQGLSAFHTDSVAIQAGRIMHTRIHELAEQRANFAFETTLASRSFAPWLKELRASGYLVHLVFLWLPSPEFAIGRVAMRVEQGGHHVPDETVVRRYHAGLNNFFQLYRPVADSWSIIDNSGTGEQTPIALWQENATIEVLQRDIWQKLLDDYS
ncbi:Zeta toxin [Symmachiella macrocystis]|uniref:Zeta toxin n=1 Tax=Symmachiella macrocystis TaxID=2527985 RepID=A0A5C6BBX6_9PLAN|nr:zeta toxin family protein [Symmachiella macrocystis]TWU09498.1 Zeta toxin [Symmachiella macrocystis]